MADSLQPVCEWVKPDSTVCGRPANFTGFCRTHEILHGVGYQRPKGFQSVDSTDKPKKKKKRDSLQSTQRDLWKQELEEELHIRGLKKGRQFKAKDFPQHIDGLLFATIDEYHEWQSDGGEDFLELESVDRPYDNPRKSKNHGSYSYSSKNYDFDYQYKGYTYVAPPPPPPVHFPIGTWKRVDQLAHMRYLVLHANDGLYYAVWLSLDLQKEARTCDVMPVVMTMTLPLPVTEVMGQLVHTSRGYKDYWDADDRFNRGYENVSRTKERYKKAANPDWIPPNLRKLAIMATFHPDIWENNIPKSEHNRLAKWLDDGCKGWFGRDPSRQWYKARGLAYPKWSYVSSSNNYKYTPVTTPLLPEPKNKGYIREIWDGNLKRMVKKWFDS